MDTRYLYLKIDWKTTRIKVWKSLTFFFQTNWLKLLFLCLEKWPVAVLFPSKITCFGNLKILFTSYELDYVWLKPFKFDYIIPQNLFFSFGYIPTKHLICYQLLCDSLKALLSITSSSQTSLMHLQRNKFNRKNTNASATKLLWVLCLRCVAGCTFIHLLGWYSYLNINASSTVKSIHFLK